MAAAGVYKPTRAELQTWGVLIGFTKAVDEILQPAKDEAAAGKNMEPIRPVFRTAQPRGPSGPA